MICGYDKFFKTIRDGAVIAFKQDGIKKIGHLWYNVPKYSSPSWIVSFNHRCSETAITLTGEFATTSKITCIRVLGNIENDEHLLKKYYE
jgi:hypothetical protein